MPDLTSPQEFSEVIPGQRLSAWDVFVGILPLIGVSPFILAQGLTLWRMPETKIGLLVWLVVAGIVMWTGRGSVTRHSLRMRAATLIFFFSTALLVYGVIMWSLNWMHVASAGILVAWGLGRCSQRRWHEVVAWGLLLLMTIPISQVYVDLDRWISDVAAQSASTTLDAHDVPHLLDGQTISLQGGNFQSSSTTSAKLGLYAVLCSAALWCWGFSRSLLHSLLLLIGSSICLLMTRYLAMLLVSFGMVQYSSDWTVSGLPHYFISFGAFGFILVLVLFCDRMLLGMLSPVPLSQPSLLPIFAAANKVLNWPEPKSEPEEYEEIEEIADFHKQMEAWRRSWYSLDWNRRKFYKAVAWFCGLTSFLMVGPIAFALIRGGLPNTQVSMAEAELSGFKQSITPDLVSAQFKAFKASAFSINGKSPAEVNDVFSGQGKLLARWAYSWNGMVVVAELAAPEINLRPPLANIDSKAIEITQSWHPSINADSWGYYDSRQVNVLGGNAYVLQSFLNDDLSLPKAADNETSSLPYTDQLNAKSNPIQPMYEIRVSCDAGATLSLEQLKELQEFFDVIRKTFREKLPSGQLKPILILKQ